MNKIMDETETVVDENIKYCQLESGDALNDFEKEFQKIYDRQQISNTSVVQLYTQVYNYCSGIQIARPLELITGAWKRCRLSELYGQIKQFLERYVINLEKESNDLTDQDILRYYSEQWNNYKHSSNFLDGVCTYINRHWVWQEKIGGRKHIVEIDQLALEVWKQVTSRTMNKRVVNIILKLIESERCGGIINTSLIGSVIKSFIEQGLTFAKSYSRKSVFGLSVYKEVFEKSFLDESSIFYTRESAENFAQNSTVEYLTKVETRFQEEEKRVQTYLHESCFDPLLKICRQVWIESRLDILLTKFKNALSEENYNELTVIYKLASKLPECIHIFLLAIEELVRERGLSAIEKCGTDAVDDPKLYVDTILGVRKECLLLISKISNDDPGCIEALDKACEKFINHNYVTKMPNSSTAKTPELIVKYCDSLLKKNVTNLDAAELDEIFTQIMVIFKYIEDKDIFQKLYSKMLATRLARQLSTSDDAEESMISKMKQTCGVLYTAKLQRMFSDIALNKNLNEKFRIHLTETEKSLDLNFEVQVLSSGSWPFQQSFILSFPTELEKSIQEYMTFYNSQFNGRKLTWLYQLCRGELVANCFEKRYILQVSASQMAILLLFNAADNYSLQQIEELTKIKYEYLVLVIQLLLKSKLLICDGDENNLGPNSIIKLFLYYKNKKQRVNLNMPLKMETNNEQDIARKYVEQERMILIQAAIIRVMKARKQLQHQQLLSEIFVQLSSLFKPKVVNIKKCIDVLVEKEYLERLIDERNIYQYMA